MIEAPNCWKRKCKWFSGVIGETEGKGPERPVCVAFPNGIPKEIAYGKNLHKKPLPNQGNDIVYEKIR